MSLRTKRREGYGDVAIWFGLPTGVFPDYELFEQRGAIQHKAHCHSGEFNLKGSLDGINYFTIVNLSAGESATISTRPLWVRCDPVGADYVTATFTSHYVSRFRSRVTPRNIFNQPVNVGGVFSAFEDTSYVDSGYVEDDYVVGDTFI